MPFPGPSSDRPGKHPVEGGGGDYDPERGGEVGARIIIHVRNSAPPSLPLLLPSLLSFLHCVERGYRVKENGFDLLPHPSYLILWLD